MSSANRHSSTWAGHEIIPPEPSMSICPNSTGQYPQPLDDYQRFVVGRMADGVRIALNNLEPARTGWGSGNVSQQERLLLKFLNFSIR